MKTEGEVWREYQKIRELLAQYDAVGVKETTMLRGAQQCLGWVLDQLRSPAEADDVMRRFAMHNRKRAMMDRREQRSHARREDKSPAS